MGCMLTLMRWAWNSIFDAGSGTAVEHIKDEYKHLDTINEIVDSVCRN